MRGYLTVDGTDVGAIPVESRVEIYRDSEGSHTVYARTADDTHDLGLSDVTVSRRQDERAPVSIVPRQSCIEVRNQCNTNTVTVRCDGDQTELDEGFSTRVEDTATITLGYQTTVRLTVEREAKTEINVSGEVSGDVVAGDQVDERTQVVDSVVNRSEISGESGTEVDDSVVNRSEVGGEGSAEVDDSVVNRSEVGGEPEDTDTQKHCETHDRMYTGQVCPDCQIADETKFCLFCGAEIPAVATVCPDCGGEFPD